LNALSKRNRSGCWSLEKCVDNPVDLLFCSG
jgi:hypothetical protein